MKKIKAIKCLCLLFAVIYSILITTSFTAFAAHTNGKTEVIARIETAPTDSTQSDTDNSSDSDFADKTNILTGDITSSYIIIALVLLMISVLCIYLFKKNEKSQYNYKQRTKL